MRHSRCGALALLLVFLAGTGLQAQVPEDPLVEKVRKAIDAGVAYLRSQQRRGNWEVRGESMPNPGGLTALSVLSLLTAGVPPQDEAIQKALEYLRSVHSDRTYVVSLQVMAFAQAGQPIDRERIQRLVDWLLEARLPGGWSYSKLGLRDMADNSNTQYALLAIHEGMRAGATVKRSVLEDIQKMLKDTQTPGGGWTYRPHMAPTMNMTTAGLCNLVITGMDLAVSRQKLNEETGVAANCGEYQDNEPVRHALEWLGARFPDRLSIENATQIFSYPFYGLYGIERAGRFTGQRYIGGQDWYEVGCRCLVNCQGADGSWQGIAGRMLDGDPLIATSFALLFLSKGRTPVLISKLAYGGAEYPGWNNKRNDVRNLVEFCSRELFRKQPLAWQVFDVRQREASTRDEQRRLAADLLQSPLVFFNGHDWAPGGREEGVLREYLANGGFVFAEACCGRKEFDESFRALMKKMFPESELTPLPAEHPVWNASGKFGVPPGSWPLEGIQHGCKWVVIYSPRPLAGYWEADLHDRGRGRLAFQLGANIVAYATGLEAPRPRLTSVDIPDDQKEFIKRNYLKVAQLRHDGDWQPAPHAIRNLMTEVRKSGLDVMVEPTPIYPTSEKVLDYYLFYMHGRKGFTEYTSRDLEHLRFRLMTGGLLLADACCGSRDFDQAFRKFVARLFPTEQLKLEPIPLTDELYSRELNGEPIRSVKCRRERAGGGGADPEYRLVPPALEGIKYKNRWVVIYSRYDLGCALQHHASTDCLGHDYDSAVRLGRAALLYALTR